MSSTDAQGARLRPTRWVQVSLLVVGLLAVAGVALTGSAVADGGPSIADTPTTFADEDAGGSGSATINTTRRNVSKTTVAPGGTTTIEVFVDIDGSVGVGELVELEEQFSQGFESVTLNDSEPMPGVSGPGPDNEEFFAFWNENANNYTISYDATVPTSASAGDTFDVTGSINVTGNTQALSSTTISVAQQPGFRLDPASDRVGTQNTTTFELVATGVNNGVTSYSANISTNDTSVASLQSVSLTNQASTDNSTVASDNSWALVEANLSNAHSAADEVVVAELTVDTGQEGTAAFSIGNPSLASSSGAYTIQTILGTTLKVSDAEPNFQVSNLDAPASVLVGDTVTANATIENVGNAQGTTTVEFRVAGNVLDTTTVSLDAGLSQSVSLSASTSSLSPGTYTHGIFTGDDNQTAQITVTQSAPNFGLSNVSVPSSAPNGTTVSVGALVDNTGTASGTQTLSVSAGGTTLNSTNVTLSTGASQQVSLSFDAATLGKGNYTVTVSFGSNSATSQLQITQAGVKLPGTVGPAQSVDNDPLLEDVDGDGSANVFDAIELFNQRNNPKVQNNPQFFDFDGDGNINVFDAIELYNKIQSL